MDYLIMSSVGYLIGAIPFGAVAAWTAKRIDVRDYGSGSIGVTNVLRTVGRPAAAAVLLLDMGKAILAVVLARIFTDSPGVEAAAALAVLFGHIWPVFIGFKGGKGTASGWGVLLILSPLSGLVAMIVGVPLVTLTRYMSVGSVLAAIAGGTTLIVVAITGDVPTAYIWFGVIGVPLVVVRHRENIGKLFRGEERKIGQAAEVIRPRSEINRHKGFRWPGSV